MNDRYQDIIDKEKALLKKKLDKIDRSYNRKMLIAYLTFILSLSAIIYFLFS